jgi:prepilin-type N-terminal cleavage/methylation domain-containing protein
MRASEKRQTGFTLIELLIVVVIIGILAAIAIPKFSATRERAFVVTAKADLKNLATQEDVYYNSAYTYSTDAAALGFVNSQGVTVTFGEATNTGWSASAVHAGAPNVPCAIYHGSAAQLTPATVPSVVQCARY